MTVTQDTTRSADSYEVSVRQPGQWALVWRRFRHHRLALIGSWVLLAIAALAFIGPYFAPATTHTGQEFVSTFNLARPPQLWPLSLNRILGTDYLTNPISGYVLAGGRPLLIIGFLGALIASVVGVIIGSIAGYFGRIVDTFLMRLTDTLLTIPFLPLLYLLGFYLPDSSVLAYAILFGIVGWAGVARLVRGYVLSLQQREFAEAARAMGVSDLGIIMRHLLPNTLDIIIVSLTLNIAVFILTVASLEFLGSGPATATWVTAINVTYDNFYWWTLVFPGLLLVLTVLTVNVVGDGLRDAFDTTGSGDLIRWKERRDRRGWLGRGMVLVFSPLRRPLLSGWGLVSAAPAGVRASLPARRRTSPAVSGGRAVPVARHPLLRVLDRIERLPLLLRLLPPFAGILVCMVVFLFGHSPLRYAPHFSTPIPLGVQEGNNEYGSHPLTHGAWTVFALQHDGTLRFSRVASTGQVLLRQTIARGGTEPSLASARHRTLGVWVSPDQSTVMAAYMGNHRSAPFALVPRTGNVDHPSVTPVTGGFAVLFQWHPNAHRQAYYQIYLAVIRRGATHPSLVRRIAATPDYGFYPHAVADGSGALDVLYLDRIKINTWAWRFRRFSPAGRALTPTRTVSSMCYQCVDHENFVPSRWEVDLKRARDGSVWAVWDGTVDVSNVLYIAHWDRRGHMLLPPTEMPGPGFDSGTTSGLSLALLRHGGQLYYTGANTDGGVGSVTWMQAFDRQGTPLGSAQRVAYDGGGSASLPHAGTVNGRPVVAWQRVRAGPALLEASSYHSRSAPPGLLVRLGLNVGNVWVNIGLVLIGALAGGIGVAIVNALLLLLLLLLWLPVRLVAPRGLRWPLYLAVMVAVIIEIFGVHATNPPSWVLLISGLGTPENWVAVGVACVSAIWAGLVFYRRFEPTFRAAATSFTAVYVIAVMYAVIFIQSEITRI